MIVTYEWEGERLFSPSLKKVNGVLVAKNLARPYASGEYRNLNVDITVLEDEQLKLLTTTGSGASYIGMLGFNVTPGEYFAAAANFKWGERIGRFRHQIQFRGPNNESIDAPQTYIERSEMPEGGRSIVAFEVPSGTTEARMYTWFYLEGGFNVAPENSTIYVGDYSVAISEDATSATEQVETFFNGDTPNVMNQPRIYTQGQWKEFSPLLYL